MLDDLAAGISEEWEQAKRYPYLLLLRRILQTVTARIWSFFCPKCRKYKELLHAAAAKIVIPQQIVNLYTHGPGGVGKSAT